MKPAKAKLPKEFTVIIDTREQLEWTFPNSVRQSLPAGDYSLGYTVQGRLITYEKMFTIERKRAVSELYGACGQTREQFETELENLAKMQFKVVICEFDFMDIVNDPPLGKLEPQAVYGSIFSWWAKYSVPFLFAGNRANARASAYKFMEYFTKYQILGMK